MDDATTSAENSSAEVGRRDKAAEHAKDPARDEHEERSER